MRPIRSTTLRIAIAPTSAPNTPAYAAYASNASAIGAACATVLTDVFGRDISFEVNWSPYGFAGVTRPYADFWVAADEMANSRIYGGIHFRFEDERGRNDGRPHVGSHLPRRNAVRLSGSRLELVQPAAGRQHGPHGIDPLLALGRHAASTGAAAISSAFGPFLARMVDAYERLIGDAAVASTTDRGAGPWRAPVVRITAGAQPEQVVMGLRAAVRPLLGDQRAVA